jgi:hypothetical protein
MYVESRGIYSVLVGKPEERDNLEDPRPGWDDNIKMDIQELGCEGMDWIEMSQEWDI